MQLSLYTLLELILHRTRHNLFIYNHSSHTLISDTSSSEREIAFLANAPLADTELEAENFKGGTEANKRECKGGAYDMGRMTAISQGEDPDASYSDV